MCGIFRHLETRGDWFEGSNRCFLNHQYTWLQICTWMVSGNHRIDVSIRDWLRQLPSRLWLQRKIFKSSKAKARLKLQWHTALANHTHVLSIGEGAGHFPSLLWTKRGAHAFQRWSIVVGARWSGRIFTEDECNPQSLIFLICWQYKPLPLYQLDRNVHRCQDDNYVCPFRRVPMKCATKLWELIWSIRWLNLKYRHGSWVNVCYWIIAVLCMVSKSNFDLLSKKILCHIRSTLISKKI